MPERCWPRQRLGVTVALSGRLVRISQFAYNSNMPISLPSISVTSNENRFPIGTGLRSRDGLDKEESMDQFRVSFRNRRFRDGWPKSNIISESYPRDPSKISA